MALQSKTNKRLGLEHITGLLEALKVKETGQREPKQASVQTAHPVQSNPLLGLTCSACGMQFGSVEEQRAHFQTDLHRLNVKRSLGQKSPLTEDVFMAIIDAGDELSSISGSDSEDEQASTSTTAQTFIVFEHPSKEEESFMVPKGVLTPWNGSLQDPKQALSKLVLTEGPWIVVMASGGHFAATVFEGFREDAKVLAHKTFHKYVVRAKAGGRQASKDSSGKKANSAGASLRRHNERALTESITKLLTSWADFIAKAAFIFVYAPGVYNQQVLFGGEKTVLDKKDERIYKIPFITRRPTFTETKRVKRLLSSVQHYDAESEEEEPIVEAPPPEARMMPRVVARREENPGNADENFNGETELHVASREGNANMVASLLESGADPSERDIRGRPPYLLAKTKEVRDAFRRFRAKAGENAFDWKLAGVPEALTPELEEAQSQKRAAKEEKRKKEKAKRKAQKQKREAKQNEEAARLKTSAEKDTAKPSNSKKTVKPFDMWASSKSAPIGQRERLAAAAEARIRAMDARGRSTTKVSCEADDKIACGVADPPEGKRKKGKNLGKHLVMIFGLAYFAFRQMHSKKTQSKKHAAFDSYLKDFLGGRMNRLKFNN